MEKRTIKVVCAIIRKEDKILCTQRLRKGPTYIAEHWEFPGGKVKSNENDYDALRREIKEEMELLGYILPDMDFKRDLKEFILIYLSAEKQK